MLRGGAGLGRGGFPAMTSSSSSHLPPPQPGQPPTYASLPHLTQMLLGKWAALLAVAVAMEAMAAFPSSLLIRKEYENLTLNCSSSPGEQVEWKWKGDTQQESGREFVIYNLDFPFAGNYSCWAGSRLLESFHVALGVHHSYFFKAEGAKEEPEEPAISCWATSYSGTLSCSWKSQNTATFLAHLKRKDTEAVLCPSTEVVLLGNRVVDIQFNNCSFCPYAEEAPLTPLVLVLRGLSEDGGGYSEVKKTFLLRDIVKPDAPAYLKVTGQTVSWAPPASWDLPATYFPLQYNLRLESASGSKENHLLLAERELTTKQNWSKAQIRCKDALISSSWSSWQEWKK
ncbi:interleukin-12 subunit beta-like isoform X1 [Crotalus tigris]|uniref:interleukin-12 subunit beta-like isoform X1 n=2 Tax=Crotalus tigris TaxID=88082 RepID=UPI00192F5D53|nr:interleukin-12 subunit beta-like isoform X1 [Crotalus tigris]